MSMLTMGRDRRALAVIDLLKCVARHPEEVKEGEDARGDGADIGRTSGPRDM